MAPSAEEIEKLIPAQVLMISGCQDKQTSQDVSNVACFKLPDPAGKSGGACTSALLNVLYSDNVKPTHDLAWVEALEAMRTNLKAQGYEQIPQLTSSRKIDINHPVSFINSNDSGTKRAVLIGINYVGQDGELSGCHNDVGNLKNYLITVAGFLESNVTILLDDGNHTEPTRANMLKAYQDLAEISKSGDTCFCHYSGHGGKIKDDSGDEEDGYDETLCPVDYSTAGQIRDDDLFKTLVSQIPQGVLLTCLMDSCHSGTVLDLPYKYVSDGVQTEMTLDEKFDMQHLIVLASMAKKLQSAFCTGGFKGVIDEICGDESANFKEAATSLFKGVGSLFK